MDSTFSTEEQLYEWALPGPSNSDNHAAPVAGDNDHLEEVFLQMPSMSLLASQDDILDYGKDQSGNRLSNCALYADGYTASHLEGILKKGLILPFAMDRHGCGQLQTFYPAPDTDDRLIIVKEVLENPTVFKNLSCDVAGNYFIQHVIECATPTEQLLVASCLRNSIFQLCLDRYACRVVQKALEVLSQDLKLELISQLHDANLVRLCTDQNGNHVIQKIMTTFPVNVWSFVIETFLRDERNLFETAEDKYGCRIVQLAVEQLALDSTKTHNAHVLLKRLMAMIISNCMRLTLNECSNYVIQYIIGCESLSHYRDMIIENCLLRNLLSMAQEKSASHVIEKAMKHAPPHLLQDMMDEIFDGYLPHSETHRDALDIMMFHQFGNYIVQRMLRICIDAARVSKTGGPIDDMAQRLTWLHRLSERIIMNDARLVKYSSGKKIIDMLSEVPPILRSPDATYFDLKSSRAFYYSGASFSHTAL